MPQQKLIINPPFKGYVEVPAYAEQPAGSSSDMRNVMLWDMGKGRVRVSVRPGLGLFDGFDYGDGAAFTNSVVTPTVSDPLVADNATTTIAVSATNAGGIKWYSFTIGTIPLFAHWTALRVTGTGGTTWYQTKSKFMPVNASMWGGNTGIGTGSIFYIGVSDNISGVARSVTFSWTTSTPGTHTVTINQAA